VATTPVPAVVTDTKAEAEAKLRAAGFQPESLPAESDKDEGVVIRQNPEAGVQLAARSKVIITVSTGPRQVAVPDVTGLTTPEREERDDRRRADGWQDHVVNDPQVDKGKVIETAPKAGISVDSGSAVTLRVASGKVAVPDVVSRSRADAQQALADAGLTYRTRFAFSDQPEGTVLSQTHRGDTVDVGTQIVLVVAQRRPPEFTPPPRPTTPSPTTTPTLTPTTAPTAPPIGPPTAATTAP